MNHNYLKLNLLSGHNLTISILITYYYFIMTYLFQITCFKKIKKNLKKFMQITTTMKNMEVQNRKVIIQRVILKVISKVMINSNV